MRVMQVECPSCGSSMGDLGIEGRIQIKCPYCDSTFWVEESNTFTINKNININQTNRNIDEAAILKIEAEREEKRRDRKNNYIFFIGFAAFCIISLTIMSISEKIGNKRRDQAISEGKLIPGSSGSYYEMDYKAAMKKLKTIGFKNITHIDLHEGIIFVNDGEVEDITIDGNSSFDSYDGFDPDAEIIITHK